jgi:hypothetical protein
MLWRVPRRMGHKRPRPSFETPRWRAGVWTETADDLNGPGSRVAYFVDKPLLGCELRLSNRVIARTTFWAIFSMALLVMLGNILWQIAEFPAPFDYNSPMNDLFLRIMGSVVLGFLLLLAIGAVFGTSVLAAKLLGKKLDYTKRAPQVFDEISNNTKGTLSNA